MYIAWLSEYKKLQSSTLKSYISAIKQVLITEGYEINEDRVVLDSIIRTTKARNDKLIKRLPIGYHRLNTILNHVTQLFDKQPFLCALYRAMYASAYHGLLRIGEVTLSDHVIKARDVHIGDNKRKVQMVLWTSKTHTTSDPPQIVTFYCTCHITHPDYCPFEIVSIYSEMRGQYINDFDQFFVFHDHSPVKPEHFRETLRNALGSANISTAGFFGHSFRAGHANDMKNMYRQVDEIKFKGRWKSNAVYKYFREV